jgi:hypothetical protein
MALLIEDVGIEMTSQVRARCPAVGAHAGELSVYEQSAELAMVKIEFDGGLSVRCAAEYLGRGSTRDVYALRSWLSPLGAPVVIKLALGEQPMYQMPGRNRFNRRPIKWMPALYYRGYTLVRDRAFEVVVTARVATSLDRAFDSLRMVECSWNLVLYVEQALREVLYMLLYCRELHKIEFVQLQLGNVGVKVTPCEFARHAWELPAWDATNVGFDVIGAMFVSGAGVVVEELRRPDFNRGVKIFLNSFRVCLVTIQHASWRPVIATVMNAIELFDGCLQSCELQDVRRHAIDLVMAVRAVGAGCFGGASWLVSEELSAAAVRRAVGGRLQIR